LTTAPSSPPTYWIGLPTRGSSFSSCGYTEVTLITIEGIGSTSPSDQRRPQGRFRGNHRGPSHRTQFLRAGGLLAVVAVFLAVIGGIIIFTSQSDTNEAGDISAENIGDFCQLVDTAPAAEFAPVEDERLDRSKPDASPPRFICEVKLLGDEESSHYLLLTVTTDVRVENTIGAAREAYAGAIDYEESQGNTVADTGTKVDEAGFVTVSETADLQEYRAHLRSSNAVGSVSIVVSGPAMPVEDIRHILVTVGQETLAVMGSE